MDYFKSVEKEDATHELRDGQLVKIEKPQVVDLSSLVGNKEILFEFSDSSGGWWYEAYLFGLGPDADGRLLQKGYKRHDRLILSMGEHKIRFQTDRWYPWFDGECPLPEGVLVEIEVRNGNRETGDAFSAFTWGRDQVSKGAQIIAYRIVGLTNGWIMPGENNS